MSLNSYRIIGNFTAMSPISHIGEAISTTSYLVEEPIIQENGGIENVFVYNGNAFRGQLRDFAASYLLDKLNIKVSLDAFHLLFSGGKIGGDQSINIAQAKEMRKSVPMISIFGGGIGNQILPGKLRVGGSYPVCIETIRILPDEFHKKAINLSYRQMTVEKSFTRTDDSKNPNLTHGMNDKDVLLLGNSSKKSSEVSTQMRMTSELLIAGSDLVHQIDLIDVDDIELGAFISALSMFSKTPYIGGQSNKGHGLVSYNSKIINMNTGETNDFVKINHDCCIKLSKIANDSKQKYDELLQTQYDEYILNSKSQISGLLGAEKCGLLL